MSGGVHLITVGRDEAELRLDRWFRRHYPTLSHIRLERLLRTGQVRVDGGRVKAAHRLAPGMVVRVPPFDDGPTETLSRPEPRPPDARDIAALQALVLYRDRDVIAINKPPSLAVQGGTSIVKHLDGMLDALRFEAEERPRLVHRLDRDTSGVLLLARSASSARWLATAFRDKTARKTYWALVKGVPKPKRGRIDLALAKTGGPGFEKVKGVDEDAGQSAVTYYTVVEQAAQKAAWLALMPLTGRTHQLRAHCAAIEAPIIGDGKYGGADAMLAGLEGTRMLHLHARSIRLPRPDGGMLAVTAPLPEHMTRSWRFFDFSSDTEGDPFAGLDGLR